MQSRTLCFNRTLFRKNLTRFWPLWAVPSFVGALFPMAVLTQLIGYGPEGFFGRNIGSYALKFTSFYYDAVAYALPVLSLCYAILVALAVWSYLFNNRSVGLMHTLPIPREGLFFTSFLSGMAMMLLPYGVTGLLCVAVSLCYGFFEPMGLLVTVLAVLGESLFYFCTATAAAFVTGNIFALPVLYFIFHFLEVIMDTLVSVFAGGFLFGFNGNYTGAAEFLSPTVYLMDRVYTHHVYEEVFVPDPIQGSLTVDGIGYYDNRITAVSLEGAWLIAVYALTGIVLLAAAYGLYRKRRSECAGDVVAVGWMKPVFRYGVAVCSAMAGGITLYTVFWGQFQSGSRYDLIPMLISMVIAGAIGYYAASMLLAKSLRVFRGSWKGLAVTVLCAAAICGVLKFDPFGIETRVPDSERITSLSFRAAGNQYDFVSEEDAALIEEIRMVHRAIAEDADYILDMNENGPGDVDFERVSQYNSVRLTYYLKNGTKLTRHYHVPISADRLGQEGTYDFALDRLINSEAMKLERFRQNSGEWMPESGYIYLDEKAHGASFGTKEARAIHEAVRKDIAAGTCGTYDWFELNRAGQYAMDLSLEFRVEETAGNGATHSYYESISIAVRPGMTHTVAALLEQGLVEETDLQTYGDLHPYDYDDQYQEYLKKFGYVEYDDYLAVRYGVGTVGAIDAPAASIGVIGGADGPTDIYVTRG